MDGLETQIGGFKPVFRGLLSGAATPMRSDEREGRLKAWWALGPPAGIERQVDQNRLLEIAREGGQMLSGNVVGSK